MTRRPRLLVSLAALATLLAQYVRLAIDPRSAQPFSCQRVDVPF